MFIYNYSGDIGMGICMYVHYFTVTVYMCVYIILFMQLCSVRLCVYNGTHTHNYLEETKMAAEAKKHGIFQLYVTICQRRQTQYL